MDKKIAICFYGQTRTAKVLDDIYSRMDYVDFFASTWNDFKNKSSFHFMTDFETKPVDCYKFINNTHRSIYSMYRVNKLKKRYEAKHNFKYDYVMWTRSEILFYENALIDFFETVKLDNKLTILDSITEDDNGNPYLTADYAFFSASHIFDLYASGHKYFKLLDNLRLEYGGHNYHAANILENNIEVNRAKIKHVFQYNKKSKRDIDE
jgi:hypothetical protein